MSATSARPLRVLYLHHYGPFSGASRSLLELISAFPPGEVEPRVLAPAGQFADILASRGFPVLTAAGGLSLFDNTRYSYYRGARWLVLLRELAALPSTYAALRRAAQRWPDTDIVHLNEATMLPELLLVRRLLRRPVVLHVRSVLRLADDRRSRFIARVLARHVARVVAIDDTVRSSVPEGLPVEVIHNGLLPPDGRDIPREPRPFTIGMVGNLLRVKGCLEFVQAAAICRERGLDARFVFIGGSARPPHGLKQALLRRLNLSQEVEPMLRAFVAEHGLADRVEFRGFTLDIEKEYRSLDAVCFPSHYDAPGRPIFEAAFFGLPSIAAISNPSSDTIVNGETGLAIAPKDPLALACAIERLGHNAEERRRMGENARALVELSFDARTNARRVAGLYREILASRAAGSHA